MKLTSLILDSFRCFQKADFDLSADVIAIYGRNGVGKTAVFDALEFVLIGTIDRYRRAKGAPDYLPCRFGAGDVGIRLGFSDGSPHWVELRRARTSGARWHISGSGSWKTNGEFLFDFLLDPELTPARRQAEAAGEYIRSTLLLSQHSIRDFVEADAAERTATLAYLAGAGAVQRRLEKAEGVILEANRRLRLEEQRLDEAKRVASELHHTFAAQEGTISAIREQIANQRVTRESLSRAMQAAGIVLDLSATATEDGDSLLALVGGLCLERIASCERRLNQLAEIATMGGLHATRLQDTRQLMVDITKGRARQQTLLAEENAAAARFQALEREIGELEPLIAKQRTRVNSLRALQDLQSKQLELAQALTSAEQRQLTVQNELIAFRTSFESLDSDLKSMAPNDIVYRQRAERTLSELLGLSVLPHEVSGYSSLVTTAVDQTVRIQALEKAIGSLLPSKTALEVQHNSVDQRVGDLTHLVNERKASVEETASLASRLRQHATAKECPLCGHAHPSVAALQKAIDERLSQVPEALKKAAADLESCMRERTQLASLVADNRRRLEEWQASQRDAHQQRDAAVRTVGSALEQRNRAVADIKHTLLTMRGQVRALQNQGSQEATSEDLSVRLHTEQSQLALLENGKTEKSGLREGVRNQRSSIRNERASVEQSLVGWQERLARLTEEIQAYRTKCQQLGLAEDAPEDALTSARRHGAEEISLLQSVQRTADRYALSLKLATVEKERSQTQAQLEEAQKTVVQVEKRQQALDRARREIGEWTKVLSEQVNHAVTNRIAAHKSEINSLFKAMIPSPYLFDEITMKQVGDGLELGLRYRGQEDNVGEPRFFLSNAQANVLALSLFLSFTRAQRWARLETILLDDPVQHLDDLDAVAFLDTLRSVALGGLGPRKQVIVSTCDQNLYLLMIRKFGMLESLGLRFTGISLLDLGEAGPEIVYDVGGPSGKQFLREAV